MFVIEEVFQERTLLSSNKNAQKMYVFPLFIFVKLVNFLGFFG